MIVGFNDEQEMLRDFRVNKDYDWLVFALYKQEPHEGEAMVVVEKDGKLYEIHGSHCSCFGLEDQWKPEETNEKDLKFRKYSWQADLELALEEWKRLR